MCAGSVCDIDHVAVNRVFDVDSGCFFSHFHQLFCRNDGFHFRSGDHVLMLQDGDFILRRRIADRDADHEAVCLGIRELLRARRAVGVLRCHDDEGLRDRVGLAVDGKLSFLHDFQERGLRLRRCTVDFIGKEKIRHGAARHVAELAGILVVHGKARDIRRKDVRGELHPFVIEPQGVREGDSDRRLADARNVIDQDMAPCQDGSQNAG